jgi:hypothetical protein
MEISQPDLSEGVLVHQEADSLTDYSGLAISARLTSKTWEARASAYEELLIGKDGSILFDMIGWISAVFFDEITVRGQ